MPHTCRTAYLQQSLLPGPSVALGPRFRRRGGSAFAPFVGLTPGSDLHTLDSLAASNRPEIVCSVQREGLRSWHAPARHTVETAHRKCHDPNHLTKPAG